MSADDSHRIQLPGSGWPIWRQAVLRGAGFPIGVVEQLADHRLSKATDQTFVGGAQETASQEYQAAEERTTRILRNVASDDMFREAVVWQNPSLIDNCLDRLIAPGRQKPTDRRQREALVARYVQRYSIKNDSIGFFGPVLWIDVDPDAQQTTVTPVSSLTGRSGLVVSQREVVTESWAVEALARAIERLPGIEEELPLRRHAGAWLNQDTLRMHDGREVQLTVMECQIWRLPDGLTTHEVLADFKGQGCNQGAAARDTIQSLIERGLLVRSLDVPIGSDSLNLLRDQVLRLSKGNRQEGLNLLDRWDSACAKVSTCAGDSSGVRQALSDATKVFQDITGKAGYRRPGEVYAARTPLYEDCTRALNVRIGRDVLNPLARPLSLILDSVSWFTAYAGVAFRARFEELYDRLVERSGTREVPLARLLAAATPDLAFTFHRIRPFVQGLRSELWHRWESALQQAGTHSIDGGLQVCGKELEAAVHQLFPHMPAPWSSALRHSPDVMIAAKSLGHLQRNESLFVLGELHASTNTLMSRLFVDRHSDPQSLSAFDAADSRDSRFVTVPSRSSGLVNSRTFPPVEPLERVRRWTPHSDHTGSSRPPTPAAELVVMRNENGIVVKSLRDAGEHDLLEALGDQLSSAVLNAFSIFPPVPHQRRVTLDRLVIQRETWRFEGPSLTWAQEKDGARRFLQARRWRAEKDLPEQIFFRAPHEPKPVYIDLRSTVLVEIMAKSIRRAAREHAEVVVSEALPDSEHSWLTDQDGNRYSSELRFVAVDRDHT